MSRSRAEKGAGRMVETGLRTTRSKRTNGPTLRTKPPVSGLHYASDRHPPVAELTVALLSIDNERGRTAGAA